MIKRLYQKAYSMKKYRIRVFTLCAHKDSVRPSITPSFMANINIRANENLKKTSTQILKEMGLDMSTAITLFLQQVVITKSLPFPLKTINGFSALEEAELLKTKKHLQKAVKNGKAKLYQSAEDLSKDLLY